MTITHQFRNLICLVLLNFLFSIQGNAAVTNLGSFGETLLQKAMGDAVQTVCGGFVGNQDAVSEQQIDLFNRCGEMVHSANELLGLSVTSKSLGVTAKELSGIIQQIAGEEVTSQGSVVADAMSGQSAIVMNRMASIIKRTAGLDTYYSDEENQYALNQFKLGMGAGDEAGEEGMAVYVNGSAGQGDRDTTQNEDGFELDGASFVVGFDKRINDNLVMGGSIGMDSYDADFDITTSVTGGSLSADSTMYSIYGLYVKENYYATGLLSIGTTEFETSRRVFYTSNNPDTAQGANRFLRSDTDSDQTNLALSIGYQMVDDSVSYDFYVKYLRQEIDIDGFSEKDSAANGGLGLRYDSQDISSSQAVLGFQANTVISKDYGVFNPYFIAEWHQEFDTDANQVMAQYIHDPRNNKVNFYSDEADSSFMNLSFGTTLVLPNSIQLFVDLSTLMGMDHFDYTTATIGIKKAF